jgi:hypothetical protein
MPARFIVGDTRAVTATLADGSVDFIMSSPPYLALRSYLPADHPMKPFEIGSEATPSEFIDVLLALTAEWRRILNPRTGSIVIELGDTYAGSGGGGGDYLDGGWREGQAQFAGSAASGGNTRTGSGTGWPRPKSNCGIPGDYAFALRHGYNPHNGSLYHDASPAGRWQIRNEITRCSPNPPVGALGKKWRPATTDLVVATPDDDKRYWDDVATRVAFKYADDADRARRGAKEIANPDRGTNSEGTANNPAGAPLLDWWQIVAGGYPGAHYAVYPPELCEPFIEAMCPRRVCLTCGEPSRRETSDPTYERTDSDRVPARLAMTNGQRIAEGVNQHHQDNGANTSVTRQTTTTGWTTCGHPGTDGHRLDGYHTGTGWRPGIVLDPFAGTGTTLAVATGHGRDAIGIDLDPRNADLALQRVGPLLLTVEHHETAPAA